MDTETDVHTEETLSVSFYLSFDFFFHPSQVFPSFVVSHLSVNWLSLYVVSCFYITIHVVRAGLKQTRPQVKEEGVKMHKSANPLTHDKEQLSVLLYLTHYHPVCCFEDTLTGKKTDAVGV